MRSFDDSRRNLPLDANDSINTEIGSYSRAARPTVVRYSVLAWLSVVVAIAYIDRGVISVAVTRIEADLGLDDTRMSYVLSGFYFAYALFQVPAAALAQRWGNRATLPVLAALWSGATAMCAAATGFYSLLLARLLMGVAEAGVVPCAAVTLSRWFPRSQCGWFSGILGCFMGIGSALGNLCGASMLAEMSWRSMFLVCSFPGFVWAIGFWIWFRDRPEEHRWVNREELDLIRGPAAAQAGPIAADSASHSSIWLSPTLWGIAAQQFFRAAAAVLYITWFPGYLERTYAISIEDVGIFGSLPLWVMLGGAILGGVCSDWVTNRSGSRTIGRKGFALACTAAGGLSMLAVVWLPGLNQAITMICLSTLMTALAGPCAYAVSLDTGGPRAGKVFAAMNMAGNVGAMLFPLVMTRFVSWYGDWTCLPWFVAALLILSALCWLPVNANRVIGTNSSVD